MTTLKSCPSCGSPASERAQGPDDPVLFGCTVCTMAAENAEDWNLRSSSSSADNMTKRQYIAVQALSGLLASSGGIEGGDAILLSLEYADALLSATEREST